jgi:hypothetical protein
MHTLRKTSVRMLLVVSLCATGCLSRQVARDGDNFREALVAMYTDQAIDNLIRAYNNQGFVQLKYHDLLNDDQDTYTGTARATQTETQIAPLAVTALSGFTRDLINFWTLTATSERKRQMQFFAEPVTDQNDVYEAYLCFAQDPTLFRKTKERPAECAAHIVRKKDGCFYWVPADAGPAFLNLALRTSVMREGPNAIESYYERVVLTVEPPKKLGDEGFSTDITFAKGKEVPNGNGTIVVVMDNRHKVAVRALKNVSEKEASPVTRLTIQVLKGVPLTVENLQGAKVRFYSDFYPPEAPAPPLDLAPVLRSLERIRQTDSTRGITP